MCILCLVLTNATYISSLCRFYCVSSVLWYCQLDDKKVSRVQRFTLCWQWSVQWTHPIHSTVERDWDCWYYWICICWGVFCGRHLLYIVNTWNMLLTCLHCYHIVIVGSALQINVGYLLLTVILIVLANVYLWGTQPHLTCD